MKKPLLILCLAAVVVAGVAGLFVYRKATPSSADHRLLSLASGGEAVTSVALNLRLLKSARSMESLKAKIDSAEKYLLKAGDIQPRHRDLFLETFSSIASGSMKTAEGTAPYRVFATHGPAEDALKALETAHLVEAASGEDYVLIHPETCEKEGPLRLVQGERVLAFVPAELAEAVSARLAQEPGQRMDSLLIGRAGVNVRPYLEELAHPFVQMIAGQEPLASQARTLEVSLRADTGGGLWAELDVATGEQKKFQELWEQKVGGDSPVRAAVEEAVTLETRPEGLRFTFNVNVLQKHADGLLQAVAPSKDVPLKTEDVEAITEETLAEDGEVYAYDAPLTAESFFSLSGEECEVSKGVVLGEAKKLGITFEALRSHSGLPGSDFITLAAEACVPPAYVPLLGERPLLEVALKSPEPVRHSCGPLAAEADGVSSKESIESSRFSNRHEVRNEVRFALKPGVDTQTLPAIEGSVTVNLATRVKTLKLDFRPPYAKAELVLPEGRLSVAGVKAGSDGLMFKLTGEGDHSPVIAVRALNAEGKYLHVEPERVMNAGGFFNLPFEDLLPQEKGRGFVAYGKPARLEVVVVEAVTPLAQAFSLKPPFPAAPEEEDEEGTEEAPAPVEAFTQAAYEKTFLAPEHVARAEAAFQEYLDGGRGDQVGNRLRTESPFKIALRTEGIFAGNLSILFTDDVGAGFGQMNTPLELEVQEVDFVDGTRLKASDMEQVEEAEGEKQYVWGDKFGRKAEWKKSLSLRQTNGGYNEYKLILFDDYMPGRMEEVPVARVKGQLSFSLPESIAMSEPVPVSLHSRAKAGKGAFRITSIEDGEVTVVSENTDEQGFSAMFTDAAGRLVEASLSQRKDSEDGTFQLEFNTRGPVRQWRMVQAQGGSKTYTYPFEIVAHELKPAARQVRR